MFVNRQIRIINIITLRDLGSKILSSKEIAILGLYIGDGEKWAKGSGGGGDIGGGGGWEVWCGGWGWE